MSIWGSVRPIVTWCGGFMKNIKFYQSCQLSFLSQMKNMRKSFDPRIDLISNVDYWAIISNMFSNEETQYNACEFYVAIQIH